MRLARLGIENLRAFSRVELSPAPHFNQLVGDNGAGKTSVLEAIHLLSTGRSFRSGARDALIRRGESSFRVFAQVSDEAHQRDARLGLERGAKSWAARLDGEPVTSLSQLFAQLAVLCFEPASHQLIGGAAEHRRRFVDWALFHVEPHFLPVWRRYQRALKQRNALLRANQPDECEPWEMELAVSGVIITEQRRAWLSKLEPSLQATANRFLPELGEVRLQFSPGWNERTELRDALIVGRTRDAILGHSATGPHRADWVLSFEHAPSRDMLSRGQEKLAVLVCLLAQAERFSRETGRWPVLLFDDLASELDAQHLQRTLEWLAAIQAQVWITGTSAAPIPATKDSIVFHVEHGQVEQAGNPA
ncbi:MAG: DNA replication/repair protein RecF [Lysobacteraceae bacterium]